MRYLHEPSSNDEIALGGKILPSFCSRHDPRAAAQTSDNSLTMRAFPASERKPRRIGNPSATGPMQQGGF